MKINEEEEFSDWCCSFNFEGERYGMSPQSHRFWSSLR